MRLRAVLTAALVATACERGGPPPREPAAAGERAEERRVAGRRGDRHARAAARRSRAVKHVAGTLARAERGRVVIRAPGVAPLTLRVAPGTTVTVDGRPSGIDALREGAEVRAAWRSGEGGRPTAIAIEAVGPPPAGDGAPAAAEAVPSDG